MNNELKDRLKQARHKAGLTQAQVASMIDGLSQPAYSDLEIGKSKTTTKMAELADLLGVNAIWLSTGKGTDELKHDRDESQLLLKSIGGVSRMVPIRGKAQMGDDGFWCELDYPAGHGDGYVNTQGASEKAYAIEGAGMSMYPVVRAGWVLVFEPDQTPHAGEFVHVGLIDGQRMIKEFISNKNGVLNLLSINGDERLAFDVEDIEFVNAFSSLHPPSAVIYQ